MSRFILRFRGAGAKPSADVARIRGRPGVTVIDDTSSRMLLVEGPEDVLQSTVDTLPNWEMTPERTIPLPSPPRPRLLEGGETEGEPEAKGSETDGGPEH